MTTTTKSKVTGILSNLHIQVTDTTLDQSDATVNGSIAYALAAAESAGGGIVELGIGTFDMTGAALSIGKGVSLVGSGKDVTIINQNHITNRGIEIDSGTAFIGWYGALKDFTLEMPTGGSAGDAIDLAISSASFGLFSRLEITGGDVGNWGITNNGNNQTNLFDVYINGECNGYRFLSLSGAVNYGDCFSNGLEVTLQTASTTGILIKGALGAVTNNMYFNRTEIKVTGGVLGCIGIHLDDYANRHTFVHTDIENIDDTGVDVLIDANADDNAFIQTFHIGTGTSYLTDANPLGNNTFIGGTSHFQAFESFLRGSPLSENVTETGGGVRTLTEAESGKVFYTKNATENLIFRLPSESESRVFTYTFYITHLTYTFEVRGTSISRRFVLPDGTELAGVANPYRYQMTANTSGPNTYSSITVTSTQSGLWFIENLRGTWVAV